MMWSVMKLCHFILLLGRLTRKKMTSGFFEFSALCRKTYAFRVVSVSVRVSVRVCATPYLENRASDFFENLRKVVS